MTLVFDTRNTTDSESDLGTDGGYGVDGGGDSEAVSVAKLLPLSPVKGNPGCVLAVLGDRDLQLHTSWHHYGSGGAKAGSD